MNQYKPNGVAYNINRDECIFSYPQKTFIFNSKTIDPIAFNLNEIGKLSEKQLENAYNECWQSFRLFSEQDVIKDSKNVEILYMGAVPCNVIGDEENE